MGFDNIADYFGATTALTLTPGLSGLVALGVVMSPLGGGAFGGGVGGAVTGAMIAGVVEYTLNRTEHSSTLKWEIITGLTGGGAALGAGIGFLYSGSLM